MGRARRNREGQGLQVGFKSVNGIESLGGWECNRIIYLIALRFNKVTCLLSMMGAWIYQGYFPRQLSLPCIELAAFFRKRQAEITCSPDLKISPIAQVCIYLCRSHSGFKR
jgi:hypothetical protein